MENRHFGFIQKKRQRDSIAFRHELRAQFVITSDDIARQMAARRIVLT